MILKTFDRQRLLLKTCSINKKPFARGSRPATTIFFVFRILTCTAWRRRRSSSASSCSSSSLSLATTAAATTLAAAAACPLHSDLPPACADRRCPRHAIELQPSPLAAASPLIIGNANRSTSGGGGGGNGAPLLHPQLLTHRSLPGDVPHRAHSPSTSASSTLERSSNGGAAPSPPASPTPSPLSASSHTPTRTSPTTMAAAANARSPSLSTRTPRHTQPTVSLQPTATLAAAAAAATAVTVAQSPLRAPGVVAFDRRRQTSLGSQPLPRPQPLEPPLYDPDSKLAVRMLTRLR